MSEHVKETLTVRKRYFAGKIHSHFLATFLLLRYSMPILIIARDLWWANQE
jgi:hypothetical protein